MGGDESDKPTDPATRFSEACMLRVGKAGAQGALAGVLGGAAILSWYPDPYRFDVKGVKVDYNIGFRYTLRNLKAPVMWSALVCGVFAGVDCLAEQMRDANKESTYVNSTLAGAAAGLVMGSMSKRIDVMATSALGVGMLMGMVEYNGQSVVGSAKQHTTASSVENKETTVNELKEKYPEFKHL